MHQVNRLIAVSVLSAAAVWISSDSGAATAPPQVNISQSPLTVAIPAHAQVVFAVANSESMDGDLSGAIYLGTGSNSSISKLNTSSSPVNYTIPSGFTPPLNQGSGGTAPYTVTSGSNLADNSPSRLNVAKAGIATILNNYMGSVDFALLDYSTSGTSLYTTWVYYMSPSGGFTFTSTSGGSSRTVANPCYQATGTDSVSTACTSLVTFYGATAGVKTLPYMVISSSSDDAAINDVLYAGSGLSPVFVAYSGPSPANPYPPNYTLAQYNSGSILETYKSTSPNNGQFGTSPTNAGFVPFTTQVMYSQRGFGYGGSQSATGANTVLPMTSAGATPTVASTNAAIAKFTPYLAPETNSSSTTEIKAVAGQSPVGGLLKGALAYFNTNPASNNGCKATKYVVLVSDGLPTEDLSGKSWPPLGSAAATGYGVTATFNSDGSLNTTNDQALTDAISALASLKSAGINTYVIGLGAGVDPSKNPTAAATLTAMAVAGGTGNYIAATSPNALASGLQTVLAQIIAQTQSVAAAAVNSHSLKTGTDLFQASFTTADSFADWTGDILDFALNTSNGQVITPPIWSAQAKLDVQAGNTGSAGTATGSNRVIATWSPGASAGIPFQWCSSSCSSSSIASTTSLGLALMTSSTDTAGPSRLSFLRGNQAQEQQNGGAYRNRAHILGDIVNSAPLYVGAPSAAYGGTYGTFATNNASRQPVIYAGANDGMLHAFNATTGNEMFAFIPNAVFSNLINLTNPTANIAHQYFVDGSPQAGDVQFSDSSWHTVMVSGEGGGGNSIFALDVTNPASITTEAQLSAAALWEFTDTNMGLTYSVPQIALTAAGYAVFFGNGYNSSTGTPFLYAVNPQTGAKLAKIDLCGSVPSACSSTYANGLSTVAVVNSSGAVGQPVDLLYAGDLQGNLWRVDISSSNPANWTVSVLFQARDSSGTPQPITTAPTVSLNPKYPTVTGTMVFWGTGQLVGNPDLTSTQVQTVYGVIDQTAAGATPPLSAFTRSNLVQQTLTQTSTTTVSGGTQAARTASNNPVNLPAVAGWYVDLNLSPAGERVVANAQIENGGGVVVTSYAPAGASSASTCSSAGSSYLYVFNFATGGGFSSPQLDVNQSGSVTSADQIGGKNPVGMALGNNFATMPTIVYSTTNRTPFKEISTSAAAIQTVAETPVKMARRAWQEIR